MPTGTPTKPPAIPSAKPAEKPPARFQAEMPKIPGVQNASLQRLGEQAGSNRKILILILGTAGILAVMVALYAWTNRAARRAAETKPSEQAQEVAESPAPEPVPPPAAVATPANPDEIANVDELARPWSAKKFSFVKPFTAEKIPAMILRLPGGDLWAFSLQEPYGKCVLEYMTDLGAIAARYGYKATHPMVVNPCRNVVYDPVKAGPLDAGTWTRGEIVQGEALRPPLSIDVAVLGRTIVAKSME